MVVEGASGSIIFCGTVVDTEGFVDVVDAEVEDDDEEEDKLLFVIAAVLGGALLDVAVLFSVLGVLVKGTDDDEVEEVDDGTVVSFVAVSDTPLSLLSSSLSLLLLFVSLLLLLKSPIAATAPLVSPP